MVEVLEPFESVDSFGVTRICWDATLLEGVLTNLCDGGIHSSLLLNPQMLSDFGQALLGCHLWDGILTHPWEGGIWGKKKEGGDASCSCLDYPDKSLVW